MSMKIPKYENTQTMMEWDLVLVSAQTQELAQAACEEIRTILEVELPLLAVADPSSESPVGSGGAALNAVLVAGDELSARKGYTTLSAEPLCKSRVLVLQVYLISCSCSRVMHLTVTHEHSSDIAHHGL